MNEEHTKSEREGVPVAAPVDLAKARRRLAEARGPEYWRSLEELTETPEFEELLAREFPRQLAEMPEGVDRRRFLTLMSAPLALGGLTACTRQPEERIVSYVHQPEYLIPGRPLYYASSTILEGIASGVLVESHMGRPTKVEGNPDHPAGSGATDLFAQASVLELYDPDRSQAVRELGRIRTWPVFVRETRAALKALGALGGARVRILSGTVTSPSLADGIRRFLAAHPRGRWHQWDPAGRHSARAGAMRAFGEPVDTRYDFSRARVVVSLDSDFLASGPGSLRYARDFMAQRRVRSGAVSMNRLYAIESSPTPTGTLADHRLPLPPSGVAAFTRALAAELGVSRISPAGAPEGVPADWVQAVARDLEEHRGRAIVVPGEQASPQVHTLAHAINERLGNVGATVLHTDPIEAEPEDQIASLRELVRDMKAGEVDALIVLGGNPVYDAPADLDFTAALRQVGRRIHLSLYENETSEFCQWTVPEAHSLESWGDARAYDGTVSLVQPLIEPLNGGRSALETLAALVDDEEREAYELVKGYWTERAGGAEGEKAWRRALHDGFFAGTAAAPREVSVRPQGVASAVAELSASAPEGVEVVFRPDPSIHDGRFNNNAWLQEVPKPITKLTWDNAALVGPALAQRLGIVNEQMLELEADGRTVSAPAWIQPGHPDGMITLHLGYGRARSGRVGSGAGFDVYPLRASSALWTRSGISLRPGTESYPLASTQLHSNIELETREADRRHPVRAGSLARYREDPEFARHMGHTPPDDLTMFPPVEYDGNAWGLAVDLTACTGCNACVVACQSENNIPVVGKKQVGLGREMHWIRIDRYFHGDLDDPAVHNQPVMCMHCEMAPCEIVCPVAATVHNEEGLNDMVYNRCVGTRYCSNNCPYKVRRFNFLKYTDTETPLLKLGRNPDVTVRSRGVMEKCSYCVQRINYARIEARTARREVRDGDIQTACQQSCPTGAIVFGDINDPESRVARWKAEPLNYGMLEELNTRPRTSYLARLNNPNPELERATPSGGGHDGAGDSHS